MPRSAWVARVGSGFVIALLVGCSGGATGPGGSAGYHLVANLPGVTGARIEGIAHGSGGYLAVGLTGPTNGGAWTSADGAAWTQVTAGFEGIDPAGIAPAATGYVVVGKPALETSESGWLETLRSPDGSGWTKAEFRDIEFEGYAVVPGGPGFVAVGTAYVDPALTRWDGGVATSTDGSTWAGVHVPSFEYARMTGIANHAGLLVAVGRTVKDATNGIVWTSSDGKAWDRLPDAKALDGAGMNAVIDGPKGLIAVGGGATGAAVWQSRDGKAWTRAPDDPALAGASMYAVAATPAGYIAVGYDQARGVVWTSTDGTKWVRAPDQPDFADTQLLGVIGQPRVLIVGGTKGSSAPMGFIWTGS